VTAYVVSQGSNTVTPIDTATNRVLKAIKVGFDPLAIAITPGGKTAYVAVGNTVVGPPASRENAPGAAVMALIATC
jgi:YVTN family beta-propeller protein